MFGETLSCMNTMGGASIVGTTAELKAWTLATVWGGLTATMSSKNKCKISSTFGKTLFSAKANASFASDDEMGVLERGLAAAVEALGPGGRICVLTFHSTEDRIVKRFMRENCDLPFRKPMVPTDAECRSNPRARSTKLRCGIKREVAA